LIPPWSKKRSSCIEKSVPLDALSPREREVLASTAEGGANAGIACRIFVSEGTAEKHVRKHA
jgi:serine/threonine-protein kinase PknK